MTVRGVTKHEVGLGWHRQAQMGRGVGSRKLGLMTQEKSQDIILEV